MTRYEKAQKEFAEDPSPENASAVLSLAMQASVAGEIDDAELMKAVLTVRDYVYRQRH